MWNTIGFLFSQKKSKDLMQLKRNKKRPGCNKVSRQSTSQMHIARRTLYLYKAIPDIFDLLYPRHYIYTKLF